MILTDIGQITLTENQILNWSASLPWIRFTYINGAVTAVSETQPSQAQIDQLKADLAALPNVVPENVVIRNFNPELCISREAQVFNPSDLKRLMPVSYTINELIRFKNFWGGVINGVPYAGLKQILQSLIDGVSFFQSDYDKLNCILKEQGIDLDSH